ncbi:Jerky [Araneus ventricosus]|uniref:Jerky n=1 Tax=Araneus ventricosus TaxID=182803 RepID=A0A4Y2CA63_ARAVE|nr:Jerky [Araneus ventricosus]
MHQNHIYCESPAETCLQAADHTETIFGKVMDCHKKQGIQASSGWLDKFKNRYGISQLSIVGEKLSSNIEAGNSFIVKLEDLIVKEKLTADQIYNYDKTGLYWRALPTKTLVAENAAVAPGRKKMKNRVTILGCANASGSHRRNL